MTLRVLIVDDEPPARERMRRMLGVHSDVECVGEAEDGVRALRAIEALGPDLVLLDIQMPELDGLSVAEALSDERPAVIFVTAYDDRALRAFELAAVDYLLKPVVPARLREALDRVRAQAGRAAAQAREVRRTLGDRPDKMAVRSGAKYVVFDPKRVAAILAQDHYATVLVDGRELLSDDSLDKLMARLDPSSFLRVHRSAIVNIDFVDELHQMGDRKFVAVLKDAARTQVPISRERLDEVKARLGAA
jgi:two-component system LytT family response regulator